MHQHIRSRLAILALAAALLAAPASAAADQAPSAPERYSVRLLRPAEGFVAAAANGINDQGTVVGLTRPTSKAQPQHAALWQAGAEVASALPQLDGSRFARAFDIGADGTIAGEAFNTAGNSVPVAWSDSIRQLPSPNPDGLGVAWDVADDGTVLASTKKGTKTLSYLITDRGVTELADPSSETGQATLWRATSISGDGHYQAGVATIDVPHGGHTHQERMLGVWHDDHVHLFEPEDEAHQIDPRGINNQAVVVGATIQNRVSVATRWVRGKQEALAEPGVEGLPHSVALAINDSGVTVGYASKMANNYSFGGAAIAWFGGRAVDLNSLAELPSGVTLLAATDINSSGQIVGAAQTPDGTVGFVLTPQASPSPSASPSVAPEASQSPSPDSPPGASLSPSAPGSTSSASPSDASPSAHPHEGTPTSSASESTSTAVPTSGPRPGLPKTGQ